MADKRFLRSPINLYASLGASAPLEGYIDVDIYINGSATPLYSMRKYGYPEIYEAYFDVSFLLSDYLQIEFDGTYTSQSLQAQVDIQFYFIDGSTAPASATYNFYGVDGYTKFDQGANVIVSGTTPAITTRTIYLPENTTGYIPTFSATGFTYNSVSATQTTKTISGVTWKVERICSPKYTPYKVTFVNKFGALEDMYFFLVRKDSVETKHESFKRNIVNLQGTYDTNKHQNKTYNFSGTQNLVMNTTYVHEEYNDTLEELILSKFIWLTDDQNVIRPIVCKTKSLEKKTHLVDGLIQYEIGFEYANNLINNIR